jgi:ketosteroid isomerase-like protein
MPVISPPPAPMSLGAVLTRVGGVMLIATVLAGVGLCRSLPRPDASDAREAAIADTVQRLFSEYGRALNDGDIDRASRFFADDPRFAWFEDGASRFASRADVRAALIQARSTGGARTRFASPQVTVIDPQTVTLAAMFRETYAGSDVAPVRGVLTITLVREPEGWRFLVGHRSRDSGG